MNDTAHTEQGSLLCRNSLRDGSYNAENGTLNPDGDVAQMVERPLRMREVGGSIPSVSTRFWWLDKGLPVSPTLRIEADGGDCLDSSPSHSMWGSEATEGG